MSLLRKGKLYNLHHFFIEASETENYFPITVNGVSRIKFFNSSLEGRFIFFYPS
jgi:hypothetical protein